MANTIESIKGKSGWSHVIQPGKYGKWTQSVNLDTASLTKVLAWKKEGIKNELTKDDDGYWITLSRPCFYEDKLRNKIALTPPSVVNADNTPFEGQRIGKGSDIEVKVELREFTVPVTKAKAKSARLIGVKIHNLVDFEPVNSSSSTASWENEQ